MPFTWPMVFTAKSRLNAPFIMNLIIHSFTKNKYNETLQSLPIEYDFLDTQLGILNIAYSSMGVCHLSFQMSQNQLIKQLKYEWPKSPIKNNPIAIDLKNRILQNLDHQLIEKTIKNLLK